MLNYDFSPQTATGLGFLKKLVISLVEFRPMLAWVSFMPTNH